MLAEKGMLLSPLSPQVFGIVTGSDEGLNYEAQGDATEAVEPLVQCVGNFREQVIPPLPLICRKMLYE